MIHDGPSCVLPCAPSCLAWTSRKTELAFSANTLTLVRLFILFPTADKTLHLIREQLIHYGVQIGPWFTQRCRSSWLLSLLKSKTLPYTFHFCWNPEGICDGFFRLLQWLDPFDCFCYFHHGLNFCSLCTCFPDKWMENKCSDWW